MADETHRDTVLDPSLALERENARLLEQAGHALIGSYNHAIDSKGRLIIPSQFRKELGEKFCIGPSFSFDAVALYPTLVWARLREGYAKLSRYNGQLNRYLDQFDALSYRDQECDGQNRVLIPSKIRRLILGEEKDMEIAGAHDHVRILTAQKAEKQFTEFMDSLPGILDVIGHLEQQNEN